MNKSKIQLFEKKAIRTAWDGKREQWLFSVIDVIEALTDSVKPRDYWYRVKARMTEEQKGQLSTICRRLKMPSADGKERLTDVSNIEGLFRIIQSIPSPKAEPFKQWLAQVGAERIKEEEDPEIAFDRARETYLQKGYSKEWVDQRMLGIRVRNELTDEWKAHGVENQKDYSMLTAILHKGTFGITPKEHKKTKGLKSQNLRDNMTTLETVLTMLGEATTAELTRVQAPDGLQANVRVAKQGGEIAGEARKNIEKMTGKPVVTSLNATNLLAGEDDKPTPVGKLIKGKK